MDEITQRERCLSTAIRTKIFICVRLALDKNQRRFITQHSPLILQPERKKKYIHTSIEPIQLSVDDTRVR